MKTGDVILDGQKNRYQVGVLLGRGLWGKTYRVRREMDQGDFVLKCPLSADDLPADFSRAAEMASVCRAILTEQVELARTSAYPFMPEQVEHFTTADGEPVIIYRRFPASLEQRLLAGAPFSELVGIIVQAIRHCHQLADGPGFHGALRPTNILLDEKGQVLVTDVATPSLRRNLALLLSATRPGFHYLPKEIAEARGAPPFAPVADSYAAGLMLWRATMGAGEALPLPRDGLDKAAKVNLKDRLRGRLVEEDSNPRFHGLLADRLGKVVDRSISVNTTPSPPYRFRRLDELLPRMDELRALVRPRVESVGRVVLNRGPGETGFSTDEHITFTASVDCSSGVDKHDEIGCGIAVFDRDTGSRIRDVPCGYRVEPYPSGRFRFRFDIESLVPGSYFARVAFAIRDSGHEPVTREIEFEVRAAPGYLPRRMPGHMAFGEIPGSSSGGDFAFVDGAGNFKQLTDAQLDDFTSFTVVFSQGGAAVTRVADTNVKFNGDDALFATGAKQLWNPTVAKYSTGEDPTVAVTMFDYVELKMRSASDRDFVYARGSYGSGYFFRHNIYHRLLKRKAYFILFTFSFFRSPPVIKHRGLYPAEAEIQAGSIL